MQDTDLIQLWKSYDKKLEENLAINRQNTFEITKLKLKSHLLSMKPLKMFTIVLGILWVVFLDSLIVVLFHFASPFLLISAGLVSLLNKLAIGIYIYQMALISEVNIDAPVISTQDKLARLKSSTIWIARILFLQIPFWTIFYWNSQMFENGNAILWTLQLLIIISGTYLALWLFFNIKYENKDKSWFKLLFSGAGWNPVAESIKLLEEVEDFIDER